MECCRYQRKMSIRLQCAPGMQCGNSRGLRPSSSCCKGPSPCLNTCSTWGRCSFRCASSKTASSADKCRETAGSLCSLSIIQNKYSLVWHMQCTCHTCCLFYRHFVPFIMPVTFVYLSYLPPSACLSVSMSADCLSIYLYACPYAFKGQHASSRQS